MKKSPIGIFDSGIGGLTIAHALKQRLPNENIIYFGDTEHLAVFKAGTLDNPNLAPPEAHVFVNTKVDWLQIPAETPSFEMLYNFEETWPASAFLRLQKVRKLQQGKLD